MKSAAIITFLAMVLVPAAARSGETAQGDVGTLTAVQGEVQVGTGDQWRAVAVGATLSEGQTIRTGAESSADVQFGEGAAAAVGADTEIAVSDLLLRARLEKMRSRVSAPGDTQKVEMNVTPTTGVRGTEQTEEKAEELKREHYWNDGEKKPE
jgi:hypothetical protein